jgi:hypothetical protein
MALSDLAVRTAKPGTKPARLFDGGGLYLEVSPAGGKLWRLKYRYGGKEKRLALGKYPDVSLKDARGSAATRPESCWPTTSTPAENRKVTEGRAN